jgi:hypothetical protein
MGILSLIRNENRGPIPPQSLQNTWNQIEFISARNAADNLLVIRPQSRWK